MKEFKKILISLLIVGGLLIIVDFTVGFCGDKLIAMMPDFSGDFAKDNYRLNRCDEDIVIVGSSRAAHHYVTSMLRDSINNYTGQNYSVYNTGIDGKFINSNACAVESIISRYNPKLLILEVGASEFYEDSDIASDMDLSAVHYRTNPVVKRYLDDIGLKEHLKMQSSMYRWNGKILRMASSFMKEGDSLGYLPLYGEMKIMKEETSVETLGSRDICKQSEDNIIRIFKLCKEKNVNLVVCSSPRYKPQDNNMYLEQLCYDYKIPYLEIYNDFNNYPELFKDDAHLNNDGAHVFSNMFFLEIKKYL